jgi:undecaprenyldiphospho-muramoylpentapeptide beta-N-acetylglucosaminyltransferase
MRLLISAGGTGGGVYPALAVASEFLGGGSSGQVARDEVLWIGSLGGMEAELVRRAGLPFQAVHSGGVHGVGWRLPLNALNLARGFFEAVRLVRSFEPEALLVTGGFVAAPVALAAWLNRVPVMVYLPDIEPGLAVRAVSQLARKIAVTADESRPYFPKGAGAAGKLVVTGYPVRPELASATRAEGLPQLGLDPRRLTVLVTGGSRGARSLNRAVVAALPAWLKRCQVLHLSGQMDWAEIEQAQAALPDGLREHYHARPFLHEMGWALAAADLVVSRAGASTLGEYPLFGLPAVLVPYPYAWRYQKVNADYLAARGAAIRLDDEALAIRLASEVLGLLDDPARLSQMRLAAQAAARPGAAGRIAQELRALGRQQA